MRKEDILNNRASEEEQSCREERKGEGDLRGEVGGGLIRDVFKVQQREFVLDSLLNGKPVQTGKQRSDVGISGGSEKKCSSIALDLLKC